MYYTDEEIATECGVVKTLLQAGNLEGALALFVNLALSDVRAWEPQNLPEDDKSFGQELCKKLKPLYYTLDYPIRLHLLWQRLSLDDDLDEILGRLKELYELFPNNEFVIVMLAYCYEKLGLYKTCLSFCNMIKNRCASSGFIGEDSKSVDYVMYLMIDCFYEMGEYRKTLAVIDSLGEISEYSTEMKVLAYRALRMYDKAAEVARDYLRLYSSADIEFFYGHICYLQNRMDLGYEPLCKFIEEHYESDYTPFALCYIGRHAEGLELARKRADSKNSKPLYKYILAEILSLTGCLDESYQVLKNYLNTESEGKGINALLVDPALENVLIDRGGLELVQSYIAKCEKRDNDEFVECSRSRSCLHGEICINFTPQDNYISIPMRVCSLKTEAVLSTACERTILSFEAFANAAHLSYPLPLTRNAVKFVHKTRQFGEITVFEWVVDIAIGDWLIRDCPVLMGSIGFNVLGSDVLSRANSINVDNGKHQITIMI